MLEFLYEYGLFFAKVATIVVAIGFILALIASAKQRLGSQAGELIVTCINDDHDETLKDVQELTLSKSELKAWHKEQKNKKKAKNEKRLFVFKFEGDIRASQTEALTKIVNTIISIKRKGDEVLCVLESGGGLVHGYGLAAAELARLRESKIPLTVAIDKVAASGGYLMACVANKIIAAPFAVVGSIGVLAQIPNFHRLLEKHDIDFEQITAGEYKRTLTLFGENTDKGRAKMLEEVEKTHVQFKEAITQYRPQIDIDKVATGEHWHGIEAFEYKLVDSIQTSEGYITDKLETSRVFMLDYEEEKSFSEKVAEKFSLSLEKALERLVYKRRDVI